jgi:hypothetical protein
VLGLLLTGPEDVAAMQAPLIYHDDDQRLSYSSGDRSLLRRYEGEQLARLSFAALPVTPFSELARYFADPIDAVALEEVRACALGVFGLTSPRRLAEARSRFDAAVDPVARAAAALAVARLYDARLAKREALAWVERAIRARPDDRDPSRRSEARFIALNRIAVYAETLRAWLAGLPAELLGAPLAAAMAAELEEFDARTGSPR